MGRVAQEPAFDYVVTGAIAQAVLAPLLESLRPNVLADVYLDTGERGFFSGAQQMGRRGFGNILLTAVQRSVVQTNTR